MGRKRKQLTSSVLFLLSISSNNFSTGLLTLFRPLRAGEGSDSTARSGEAFLWGLCEL